jgi:alkanesulfonate monooxygenase SsuD/methylene tetrahydromethanopterin reductase-like flavin-dependent oxidoreductase (luciferase family)
MRYGFVLPGGSAGEQLQQAVLADAAGWDGVFVWEAAYGIDAWTLLAAMAQRTEHVRLGTMLTPLPWRRPWKVASQALTLDQLSGGRAILAVGLGAVDDALGHTGDETDRRVRAELMDEGIDLIHGLWRGELRYAGSRYDIDLSARSDIAAVAKPVQKPRIPIWVVGAWPRPKSMRRVLRCDGVLPNFIDAEGFRPLKPADVRDIAAWLAQHGAPAAFDIVVEGETPGDNPDAAAAIASEWADAGATWWLETRWALADGADERAKEVERRLRAGPPRPR